MKFLLIIATLEKQKLNFSRCALFHKKTRVSLKYPFIVVACEKSQEVYEEQIKIILHFYDCIPV